MGLTSVGATVTGPTGTDANLELLVDSGATYTVLPYEVWRAIGLAPMRSQRFSLADGTIMERNVSECYIRLPQGQGHATVVLGEPGDAPLLGVYTLEGFGLILNPFNRTLQPARLLLA